MPGYFCPPGYKQTEAGVIPEEWEVLQLGAIAVLERGKFTARPRNQPRFFGGNIPFIQTGDVTNSNGNISTYTQTLNAEGLRVSKLFPRDTLFFTIAANIGDIGITAFKTAATDSLIAISPKPRLDKQWLYHSLKKRKKEFEGLATQNAQLNINLEKLRPYLLAVPPLPEQRAIAGVLSDVDALIGALDQLIAKKRDLKQATMQQLLTGQTRLPGFHGEWVVKRLGGLAKIQRGASPRPIDSPIWFDENSSIGWVRISDVTSSGMYLRETTQQLSSLGVQSSRPVGRGSLIMSICATVGRPIITEIDACIHDGFVVFDNLKLAKHYLYYVLKAIEGDWSRHGQTGSQMNLNTELINRTEIRIPPTSDEQTAIAKVLSDMDAELAALEQRRDKTRSLKQGMMQELLTGRTRLV
jgi:type I restriction enzyme S subunit